MFERQVAAFNDQVKIRSARNQTVKDLSKINQAMQQTLLKYTITTV